MVISLIINYNLFPYFNPSELHQSMLVRFTCNIPLEVRFQCMAVLAWVSSSCAKCKLLDISGGWFFTLQTLAIVGMYSWCLWVSLVTSQTKKMHVQTVCLTQSVSAQVKLRNWMCRECASHRVCLCKWNRKKPCVCIWATNLLALLQVADREAGPKESGKLLSVQTPVFQGKEGQRSEDSEGLTWGSSQS